jgi:hypothetical protein
MKTFIGDNGNVFTIISEPKTADDFLTYRGEDGQVWKERIEAIPVKFRTGKVVYQVDTDGNLGLRNVSTELKDQWDREEQAERAALKAEGYRTALIHAAIALVLFLIAYVAYKRMTAV